MSSQDPLFQFARTPVKTRSHKNRFQHLSSLAQRSVLKPTNTANTTSIPVPTASFTFPIDHQPAAPAMPPKAASMLSQDATKKKVSKNYKAKGTKNAVAAGRTLMVVASSTRTSTKRALSPAMVIDRDDSPPKRFKFDVGVGPSLMTEIEATSTDGSVPPSSTDVSMSGVSVSSEALTVSVESEGQQRGSSSNEEAAGPIASTKVPAPLLVEPSAGRKTPVNLYKAQTPTNAARIEISKTPKAPWLSGMKYQTPKISPIKKSMTRPLQQLVRTPARLPGELKSSTGTGSRDLFPSIATTSKSTLAPSSTPFATEIDEATRPSASSSTAAAVSHIPKPTPAKKPIVNVSVPKPWRQNVSAAFALPVSLSPTKTPAKPFLTSSKPSGNVSPTKPRVASKPKPSILNRTGSTSTLPTDASGGSQAPVSKPNLSSTLAALMNRTTVDPHAATQAQLSTLNQALEELDAPRPSSLTAPRPPLSRPSTSLGFKGNVPGRQTTLARPGLTSGQGSRPASSLGVSSLTRIKPSGSKPPVLVSHGHPPVAGLQHLNNAANIEARRASTASLALSQSLPVTAKPGAKPLVPIYTTASGRRVVSAAARAAPLSSSGSKDKSMDDVSMANPSDSLGSSGDPSSNPTDIAGPSTPVSTVPLDILKDCVIFVDVKTEDGEDAGALFVDMLRGLGAKLLTRPGSSLTHIVYKSGLQSTLTRYRALSEPKPAVIGIGWVVECVEKREKVDTTRYLINLEEEAGSVLEGLKPSIVKSVASKAASTATKPQGKSAQTKLQFKAAPKAT